MSDNKKHKTSKETIIGVAAFLIVGGIFVSSMNDNNTPNDSRCSDWDWDEDLGVYQCDDYDSAYHGYYYYGSSFYHTSSNLKSNSSYNSYTKSSSFKTGSKGGFGGGSKSAFGG